MLSSLIPESLDNKHSDENPRDLQSDHQLIQAVLPNAKISKHVFILILCFALGSMIFLVSLPICFYLKKRQKDHDLSLKEEPWDVKSFRK
ncbi:hypothetical protein EZV62_001120 [Acer yangbiense]|uniref:Uncharacterized protein n=1 Tax=Acer yangbiense TaxID=1000413 RepID=A0A5C7ITD7_9ROSI|nr:hypothetical protein EZV62_001120 [Acer yangbiense]